MKRYWWVVAILAALVLIFYSDGLALIWWKSSFWVQMFLWEKTIGLFSTGWQLFQTPDGLLVSLPTITYLIGAGCSGFDSLRVFLLAILVLYFSRGGTQTRGWWRILIVGLPVVIAANAIRIGILFSLGAYLPALVGEERALELIVSWAHPFLGVVLYSVIFFAYFVVSFRWVSYYSKNEAEIERSHFLLGSAIRR